MTRITSCRVCGNKDLNEILNLGSMPLANSLVSKENLDKDDDLFPLELVFCPNCSLVQINETVDPEILFSKYLYFSSYSETMLQHSKTLVERLVKERKLSKESLVIEVASNDGYLLQYFNPHGIPIFGIEPAENIAKVAEEKGVPTLRAFFNLETAKKLKSEDKKADVIIGNNVLAHVANINDFVEGVHILLKDDGVAIFEFPYLREFIEKNEFDTIYHEHLFYYSLLSVKHLFNKQGLKMIDVERTDIHGGSLRIFASLNDSSNEIKPAVEKLLNEELELGLNKMDYYRNFANKAREIGKSLKTCLKTLKKEGKTIAAYGAAAKGCIILNYSKIGKDLIDFITDRSPHKQGLYMPGNHIPIYPTDKITEKNPDYLLILAWNFAKEIMKQQEIYKNNGGKFIIPIPDIKVV